MKVIKITYPDFIMFSLIADKPLTFCELWEAKQKFTDEWCCMYFPSKKDYVDNAHEYHFYTCKEPLINLTNMETTVALSVEELTI